MLSRPLYFDQRVVAHMEGRSERKWKTLRKIASPQVESEGEGYALDEPIVSLPGPDVSSEDESIETQEASLVDQNEAASEPEVTSVKILVAHPVGSTSRLVRETLESFTDAEVETTSNCLRAFELSLQKSYSMFFFGMQLGELDGPLLYELISKAYACGRGSRQLPPAVVFLREKEDPKLPEELERDVRVKDVISKPIRIDRVLKAVENIVEVKDPTAG